MFQKKLSEHVVLFSLGLTPSVEPTISQLSITLHKLSSGLGRRLGFKVRLKELRLQPKFFKSLAQVVLSYGSVLLLVEPAGHFKLFHYFNGVCLVGPWTSLSNSKELIQF